MPACLPPTRRIRKVFWVPADFDADSEKRRGLIESQLQNEIAEDILFNVLFGRLNASRVHAAIMMGSNVARPGLDLAVLHTIAVDGFVSLGFLSHKFKVSSNTVRDRISRLQMSGLVLQERRVGEAYYVGPAGRAFLRLSSQLHRLVCDGLALSVESTEILKMLDAEPFEISQVDRNFTTGHLDRNDPKMIFAFWVGKAEMAERMWGINWDQCDYKYLSDEQNYSRWLTL